jgi:uncharacterized membrane protein YqjE
VAVPVHDGRSTGEILRDIAEHTERIVRAEIQLGVTEAREEVMRLAKRGAYAVAGAAFGFLALILLLLSAVYALSTVVRPWLAALIVALAVGLAAATLFAMAVRSGRRKDEPGTAVIPRSEENRWAARRVN